MWVQFKHPLLESPQRPSHFMLWFQTVRHGGLASCPRPGSPWMWSQVLISSHFNPERFTLWLHNLSFCQTRCFDLELETDRHLSPPPWSWGPTTSGQDNLCSPILRAAFTHLWPCGFASVLRPVESPSPFCSHFPKSYSCFRVSRKVFASLFQLIVIPPSWFLPAQSLEFSLYTVTCYTHILSVLHFQLSQCGVFFEFFMDGKI